MAEKRDATLATEVLDGLGLALIATLLLVRLGGFPLQDPDEGRLLRDTSACEAHQKSARAASPEVS